MEATVVNFRQGRHHKKDKQMVLKVADSADAATKMIGKTAVWTSPAGKEIKGKITQLHGGMEMSASTSQKKDCPDKLWDRK